MRSVVVLPQPLGPSSATMLPGSMRSDTRSTARVVPNCLINSRRRTGAAMIGPASGTEDLIVLLRATWAGSG